LNIPATQRTLGRSASPSRFANDFFVNLLDMRAEWQKTGDNAYVGQDRKTKENKWTGTHVDLVIGSHAQLRAFAKSTIAPTLRRSS
jgi:catalase-peroxidase